MTMSGGGSGGGKKPETETFLMQMLRCKSAFRGWGKMPFYTIMVGVWGVPMRLLSQWRVPMRAIVTVHPTQ